MKRRVRKNKNCLRCGRKLQGSQSKWCRVCGPIVNYETTRRDNEKSRPYKKEKPVPFWTWMENYLRQWNTDVNKEPKSGS